MERIEIISRKLEELKNLDKRYSIFGSSRHKQKLGNRLREEEIIQIEKENRVVISADYKEILQRLGNGGAGCGYGLESLNLREIDPPYIGTDEILRDYQGIEGQIGMVDISKVSGYIKLFDYGCGLETGLIVKGKEKGVLIRFDCDGRFGKIENKSLLDLYEDWLDESLMEMKRVEYKLKKLPITEVIKREWEEKNFSIRGMIYSLMDITAPKSQHNTNEYGEQMKKLHKKWLSKLENQGKVQNWVREEDQN